LCEEDSNCELLHALLSEEGYEVEEAPLDPGVSAPVQGYCLVLFDIRRLTARCLEIVRAWRDAVSDSSLIVVGGRTAQASRIAILEIGVSAYFTKPVVVPELRARLRAALRHFRSQDALLRHLSFREGTIDLDARLVRIAGREVRLTPTECGILEHLASHANHTVPCGDLVRVLWGSDPRKGVHSLRLFISRLRQKLELDPAHPQYLVTQPAIGYRLQVPAASLTNCAQQ
jgi:two-component system KDP operon response regulator KdpE